MIERADVVVAAPGVLQPQSLHGRHPAREAGPDLGLEQVVVDVETMGDQKAYLQEGMTCILSIHEGIPLAIELPRHVTLEISETEPVVKGQTASSSYKPAILSNGIRTLVPPHITAGTRVVIATEDNSYVERAKD